MGRHRAQRWATAIPAHVWAGFYSMSEVLSILLQPQEGGQHPRVEQPPHLSPPAANPAPPGAPKSLSPRRGHQVPLPLGGEGWVRGDLEAPGPLTFPRPPPALVPLETAHR